MPGQRAQFTFQHAPLGDLGVWVVDFEDLQVPQLGHPVGAAATSRPEDHHLLRPVGNRRAQCIVNETGPGDSRGPRARDPTVEQPGQRAANDGYASRSDRGSERTIQEGLGQRIGEQPLRGGTP